MDPNLIATLLVLPAVLAAVVAFDHARLRPTRITVLRIHAALAIAAVALLVGRLVPALNDGISGLAAIALLSATELGIAYAFVVAVWIVIGALESAGAIGQDR